MGSQAVASGTFLLGKSGFAPFRESAFFRHYVANATKSPTRLWHNDLLMPRNKGAIFIARKTQLPDASIDRFTLQCD